MDFFKGQDVKSYCTSYHAGIKEEIDRLTDSEIMSCDFHEWATYLADKYTIIPITIFETNIEKDLSEAKVKKANPFRENPYERDFFEIDGFQVTFTIPYDGNPDLFELSPNSYILSRFATNNFKKPYDDNCGSFTLDFKYTKKELKEKGENIATFVQQQFENEFRSYRQMIANVNTEVESYNSGLFDAALRLLATRKERADLFAAISSALQIPLTTSRNAPNTKPIKLQRVVRKPVVKSTVVPVLPEPYISDADYENIINIVSMCGTTMEKTARTYYLNTEEELRDHLLAALNTHYEAATGETFRKIGKTDIHIEFDNKAAFIGECKIWHGEKLFQGAVQQLLNYSTWRDLKVSVIVFNKDNQSFQNILSKIKKWADDNTASYTMPQANIWKCKYYRQDMKVDIQLTILAFDLYVDKSQFNDIRYND